MSSSEAKFESTPVEQIFEIESEDHFFTFHDELRIFEVGLQGPAGVPGIRWLGAWSALTSYVLNDAVSYNGSSWRALRANLNVTPVAGLDWALIAERGAQGVPGVGLTGTLMVEEFPITGPVPTQIVLSQLPLTGTLSRYLNGLRDIPSHFPLAGHTVTLPVELNPGDTVVFEYFY